MYKAASTNLQNRTRNAAIDGVLNRHGIDPEVFRTREDESELASLRSALRNAKTVVQSKLTTINSSIARAIAHRNMTGRFVPTSTMDRWRAQKAALQDEVQIIELELADLKGKIVSQNEASHRYQRPLFEGAFVKSAKMMLAGPVYDRICVAAVHMMKHDGEDE